MEKHGRLACSFCGKSEAEVAKLVAGPKVFICDQCVAVVGRLMAGGSGDNPLPATRRRGFLTRVLTRFFGLTEFRATAG